LKIWRVKVKNIIYKKPTTG